MEVGRRTIDHDFVFVDRRIVDLDTLDIEISGILLIQHAGSQIWDILSRVTLSGDVNLVSLHPKSVDEPFPEVIELIRDVVFILDCRRSRGQASTSGLVNINHVCQVRP